MVCHFCDPYSTRDMNFHLYTHIFAFAYTYSYATYGRLTLIVTLVAVSLNVNISLILHVFTSVTSFDLGTQQSHHPEQALLRQQLLDQPVPGQKQPRWKINIKMGIKTACVRSRRAFGPLACCMEQEKKFFKRGSYTILYNFNKIHSKQVDVSIRY